jgi:hypothetical protein
MADEERKVVMTEDQALPPGVVRTPGYVVEEPRAQETVFGDRRITVDIDPTVHYKDLERSHTVNVDDHDIASTFGDLHQPEAGQPEEAHTQADHQDYLDNRAAADAQKNQSRAAAQEPAGQ